MKKRHLARLDDFYIIIKTESEVQQPKQYGNPASFETTLIKFKQTLPERQLELWHKGQMFSTCLKFINYLQDYNLKGVPKEYYNTILKQKAIHNFVVKKRFLVTKDIVSRYLVPLP